MMVMMKVYLTILFMVVGVITLQLEHFYCLVLGQCSCTPEKSSYRAPTTILISFYIKFQVLLFSDNSLG